MAITRINSVLVKHSRVLFGVITIIIIISFVWFFTPGTSGSIFFERGGSPNSKVGTVLGEKVTLAMADEARRDLTLFQAVQYGAAPTEIRGGSMEEAVNIAIMTKFAEKLGISVSNAQVGDFIRNLPAFKGKDGKFDSKKFVDYEKNKLNPNQYTALDLDKAVKRIMIISSLSNVLGAPVVTDSELDAFARDLMEKFTLRTVTFTAADFTKGFNPATKDLQNMFKLQQSGKNPYRTKMGIQAEVVRFPAGNYAAKAQRMVKSADVKKYYEAHKTEFTKGGKVQPLNAVSRQISAKLASTIMLDLAMQDAAAFREQLYDVTSQLSSGNRAEYIKAFKQVAAKNKRTPVQTGWFKENAETMNNIGKEPVLVRALAAAALDRPITDPVKGTRTVYVAVVTKVDPVRVATFKEAYNEVRTAYILNEGTKRATEAAQALSAAMLKSKNPAADLVRLAPKAKIAKITPFSEFDYAFNVPLEVFNLAKETAKGKLSAYTVSNGAVVMVFVDNRVLPTAAEIRKMKPVLLQAYMAGKQQASAQALQIWAANNSKSVMMR